MRCGNKFSEKALLMDETMYHDLHSGFESLG
jgi:hypothetical protein